jgi:4-amino-4-deoxy-L-arabinose transferase-like glycosyltransferase
MTHAMSSLLSRYGYVFAWLILVMVALVCRPIMPIDETRIVAVAWEMWRDHSWLVPHLNSEPYSHKPPLLLWLINFSWWLFGVNDVTARLMSPLFGLADLALTARLADQLWPGRDDVERLAPLILVSTLPWTLWSTLTIYDMLLTFFTLLGLLGISRSAMHGTRSGWLLTGLAIGGGILSKGPVILLLILPVALLAPWWADRRPLSDWRYWYLYLAGAFLLGSSIALCWAIPAGIEGGEAYRDAIFWGQSAGRITHAFAHQRPWWWYLQLTPLLLFPWIFWPPLWSALRIFKPDRGSRFCLAQLVTALIFFSLISGKQVHYLLPLLPACALLGARALAAYPVPVTRRSQWLIGLMFMAVGTLFMLLPLVQSTANPQSEAARIAENAPLLLKLAIIGVGAFLLRWRPATPSAGVRGITGAVIAGLVIAHLVYYEIARANYDMRPMAQQIALLQKQGFEVAHLNDYQGDFHFLGRLRRPLYVINSPSKLTDWVRHHPNDYLVIAYRPQGELLETGACFAQNYRGRRITLWQTATLIANPGLMEKILRG